jgi:phosphatidylglycerophosphate synthase
MPVTSRALVIDARPRGPKGPMAGERVMGRPVLAHLVETARLCDCGPIAVHARAEEHSPMRSLVDDHDAIVFATGPPPEHAAILRTDRLYDAGKLRRVLRSGRDPESAVVWRLDRPSALASASDELARRRLYQPLGRFWAFAIARRLARSLVPTRVRPNAVTIASASAMIGASAFVALAPISPISRGFVASLLALGLILDTADGHLARLQGTASEFGRWLDSVLDEACDMALHGAIAWGLFRASGDARWLVLGMTYAVGKYLFVVAQTDVPGHVSGQTATPRRVPMAKTIVRLIGHADVRWHLWIALAATGRLDLALIAYAAYFPLRTIAIAIRKAVRHA